MAEEQIQGSVGIQLYFFLKIDNKQLYDNVILAVAQPNVSKRLRPPHCLYFIFY